MLNMILFLKKVQEAPSGRTVEQPQPLAQQGVVPDAQYGQECGQLCEVRGAL